MVGVGGVAYTLQPLTAQSASGPVTAPAKPSVKAASKKVPAGHKAQIASALRRSDPALKAVKATSITAIREASFDHKLWALAEMKGHGGKTGELQRLSWQKGAGWTALGSTSRTCPTQIPPQVLKVWKFGCANAAV